MNPSARIVSLAVDIDLEEGLRAHGYLPTWSEGDPEALAEAVLACVRLNVVAREPRETEARGPTMTRHGAPSRSRVKTAS